MKNTFIAKRHNMYKQGFHKTIFEGETEKRHHQAINLVPELILLFFLK